MSIEDQQAPLRQDIRHLGQMLGETLTAQEGADFFQLVEAVRALSKQARQTDVGCDAWNDLRQQVQGWSDEQLLLLARAFGQFLNLANLAEAYHQVRGLRQYDNDNEAKMEGSIEALLPKLFAAGFSQEQVLEAVGQLDIELVLTAHPTEVKRRTLIQKYFQISTLLEKRNRMHLTPREQQSNDDRLRALIDSLWLTDEIRRVRPTPVEEAKWGLAVIEETLWDAMPRYLRRLDRAIYQHTQQHLPLDFSPIRLATWMGGDRDGNPNVTAKVTAEVCLLARWMAADLYSRKVNQLVQSLSMHRCNFALRQRVGDVREPYRVMLRQVRQRLYNTRAWAKTCLDGKAPTNVEIYHDAMDLAADLMLCYTSLCENKAERVANGPLLDLIRRVHCFGLSLAQLDIRQESTRHAEAINAITEYCDLGSYLSWDESEKQQFLLAELQNKRPLLPHDMPMNEAVREVIETCRVIAKQPASMMGAYVISMAHQASDVLAVMLLQKMAGVQQPMRVVPLFETLDDLERAAEVMTTLFQQPWYCKAIEQQQEVMIGYSDSAKDAGKFAATWAQYRAQEAILAVAKQYDIELTFFHGRGGSVGRGGGPLHAAMMSQPPGSVQGRMRVTEQGEVIQQKFSLPTLARHHFMLYTTEVLEATLLPPPAPKPEWRDLMNQMAEVSVKAYRGVVRDEPLFVPYFRQSTPEQELGRLYIGSRPAKRKPEGGVESLRAIPWMFAWTQTRLLLPAWLGVGAALSNAIEAGQQDRLCQMITDWPFFEAFLDLVDMVLVKSDCRIAAYYDDCLADDEVKPLGQDLRQRLTHTAKVTRALVKGLPVQQERQQLRASIMVRNPYADPLNLLQAEILKRLKSQPDSEVLEDALMLTIAGICAAMKNTG